MATKIITPPKATSITDGTPLTKSILSGGQAVVESTGKPISGKFRWRYQSIAVKWADSDRPKFEVIFVPHESDIYDNATCKISVHVAKNTRTTNKVSGTLISKITPKGKSGIKLSWSKVKNVAGYDVFFIKCGKKDPSKVKTIKGNKKFNWTKKGLEKHTAYKAMVKAYVKKNGKKHYVRTSPIVHCYTTGGTKHYTNAKAVRVNKENISLKKGASYKIKASMLKVNKNKKLMPTTHAPKIRYLSSNKKIVTVSKKGKITAKKKGSCKVYVIAVNGKNKTVKVIVK